MGTREESSKETHGTPLSLLQSAIQSVNEPQAHPTSILQSINVSAQYQTSRRFPENLNPLDMTVPQDDITLSMDSASIANSLELPSLFGQPYD
jgi:hypothetical protein